MDSRKYSMYRFFFDSGRCFYSMYRFLLPIPEDAFRGRNYRFCILCMPSRLYIYTGALGIPASTTFKFGGVELIFYYPSASLAIWSTVIYWHPMVCGSEPKSTFNGFDKPRTACHAVSLRHTRGSHSEAAMLALPFEDYRL